MVYAVRSAIFDIKLWSIDRGLWLVRAVLPRGGLRASLEMLLMLAAVLVATDAWLASVEEENRKLAAVRQ